MNGVSAVNINTQLKGAVVIDANTARKQGNVTDVLINPDKGAVMALLFRTPSGGEHALASEDFHIYKEANVVIAFGEPITDPAELRKMLEKGVQAQGELVDSAVVTKDGRLLGRVSGVFLQPEPMRAIYHITSSEWQRLFGGGFYLAGNAPCTYSRAGARLIAPADTRRHVFRSLAESVEAQMQEVAAG
jgi:sporulation protein YlmC with PRC-barrel domain